MYLVLEPIFCMSRDTKESRIRYPADRSTIMLPKGLSMAYLDRRVFTH